MIGARTGNGDNSLVIAADCRCPGLIAAVRRRAIVASEAGQMLPAAEIHFEFPAGSGRLWQVGL